MQKEITSSVPLLDERGHVVSPGYARRMVFGYDRERIRAGPFALKEWDFYQIAAGEYVLQLTIGHVSYMASFSATLFHITNGERAAFSRMRPLPLRSMRMPVTPEEPGVLSAEGRDFSMRFETAAGSRHLVLHGRGAEADVTLVNDPDDDKMAIATPFTNPRQFYLNCKENFYEARGGAQIGGLSVALKPGDTALLDWGRGVWPFRHEWFWGNGAANTCGGRFGFNIGWGFGNTSNATENMFFWNGKAYKLGVLRAERDEREYMAPWHFCDEEGRFDFVMTPVYDNFTQTKLAFVDTRCHQVFGRYDGTAVLPGGETLEIRDLLAFCEHAQNRW